MSDHITWTNERRKLSQLIPWPRNPRQIKTDQAKRLVESFDQFGQVETIAIGPDNGVYNGHQRLNVLAQKYGQDYEVEVRVASRPLDEKEREKLTIFLHKGAAGEWDWDTLANNFEIPDLLDWGFSEKELQLGGFDLNEPEGNDPGAQMDKAEELREKWGVQLGQLWRLGEHRLICGDCTDRAVVERVMEEEKASLCVTDPPYGVNYDPSWRADVLDITVHGEIIIGDDGTEWLKAFDHVPADVLYVWMSTAKLLDVQLYLQGLGFEIKYHIIWNKDLAVFGRGNYHWKHEPCLYMVRKGAGMHWQGSRDEVTVWDIPTIHSFKNGHNSKEWGLVGHCNQKPLECMERPIKNNSLSGEIIVDLFLGSGTTLIACERLHRKCRAVEISPAYCAVAIQRWVDMTGGTPELLDSLH